MDGSLFRQFRDIAYRKAGISLKDGKESLVAARLAKRQRALGLASERDYLKLLERDETGEEIIQFLDAISTNFTSFLREADHFEFLADRVRGWIAAGRRRLRIWCAASSSGEEPYTIALTVLEAAGQTPLDVRILATDISTRVLEQAMAGVYEEHKLDPLGRACRDRHFERVAEGPRGEHLFRARPRLKELIVFKRLNLATPPYPMSGPLDLIFCRNVMMYFDQPVRQRLVLELQRLLSPDGYVFTGHAETLHGLDTSLQTLQPSVYAAAMPGAARRRA